MTIFIPSDNLIRTARSTLQVLATIASATAIVAALALTLYVLIWACSVLVLFIRSLSAVFQTLSEVVHSNPMMALSFCVFVIVFSIKIMCWVFPSLPSFFGVHGGRV